MTSINAEQLHSSLFTLRNAGVELADGIEADDVDDAVSDHPVVFSARPFAVLAQVADADEDALFALAGPGSLEARAGRACTAASMQLWDIAVLPDAKGSVRGSARVQFSEWDVADVEFDGTSPRFELEILAAIESRAL